jgi:protein SCO1
MKIINSFIIIILSILSAAFGNPTRDVNFEQKLNQKIPSGLTFIDDTNQSVFLDSYFKNKPTILIMGYYECPMLCKITLEGFVKTLKQLPYTVGKDFQVVFVSIAPKEKPDLAALRKSECIKRYDRYGSTNGWHFLTGSSREIEILAQTVGFQYRYEPETRQYAHASGLIVVSPGGKLSHYFYGIDHSPRDLRLALVESSQGRISAPKDKLLLLCYQYDPVHGTYGFIIMRLVQWLSALTAVLLIGGIISSMIKEKVRNKESANRTPAL